MLLLLTVTSACCTSSDILQGEDTVCNNETKPLSIIYLLSSLLLPQYGQTALLWASKKGHSNIVTKLMKAGAKPNHQANVRNLVSTLMFESQQGKIVERGTKFDC